MALKSKNSTSWVSLLIASIAIALGGCRAIQTTPMSELAGPDNRPAFVDRDAIAPSSIQSPSNVVASPMQRYVSRQKPRSLKDGIAFEDTGVGPFRFVSLQQPATELGSAIQFDLLETDTSSASPPFQFNNLLSEEVVSLDGDRSIPPTSRPSLFRRLWADQTNFYSPESLTLLGGGLIVGGALANTSLDQQIQKHFQSSVRGATSDDWFEALHGSKEIGNGVYTLPIFASAWAVGELFPDSPTAEIGGRWGERSLRGFLVGAPPLIVLQQFTGGSRPGETNENSEWHPMRDNNGISGHSFMGSLPFITAAKLTENKGLKVLYYAGSAIAPLSRVNDNAHYPSQVALGWWMAHLAASAVDATDNPNSRWRFYPYTTGNDSGLMAEFRY